MASAARESFDREKGVGNMPSDAQKVRPNNSRRAKLVFLAAVLGASMFPIAICRGATTTQNATEPIWPTKEWQMSTPEVEGMDSKELVKLVDWGTTHSFDSLLVVRHGKIVAEAYYAPYTAGIPHAVWSVTKSVIGTLTAIHYGIEAYASDATKSDPRFTGPIGLDGVYRKGERIDYGLDGRIGGFPRVNAVKGTWQDDHTFVIDRLVLGQGVPAERWTLTFEGEKVNFPLQVLEGGAFCRQRPG